MTKNIDKRLSGVYEKKEKLEKSRNDISKQIKANNEEIKRLEKEKRRIQGESVINKIEAKGFSVEEILDLMEKEKRDNQVV